MKKALIIGASSGIGKELALVLAKNGYEVGIMARRMELLVELQKAIPTKTYAGFVDVAKAEEATQKVELMIEKMGGVDLIVYNSGIRYNNRELDSCPKRRPR